MLHARGAAIASLVLRRWRWIIVLVVGVMAGGLLFVHWQTISILATVAAIAAEDYPIGIPEDATSPSNISGFVRYENLERLLAYPPAAVGQALGFPSGPWRAVACVALESSEIDRDPVAWGDIVVRLVDVALFDRSRHVRVLASRALSKAPGPTGTQVGAILAKVAKPADLESRIHVVEYLLRHRSVAETELRPFADALVQSSQLDDRQVGCQVLFAVAPNDLSTGDIAMRLLVDLYRQGQKPALPGFVAIARRRPEIVLEFLEGDEEDVRAAIDLMFELDDRSHPAHRRAIATAAEVATSTNVQLSDAAIRYLSLWPRTMHKLVPLAWLGKSGQRIRVLKSLEPITASWARRQLATFRFTSKEGDQLVQCLADGEQDVRFGAIQLFAPAIGPYRDYEYLSYRFTAGSGLLNPRHGAIFRALVNEPDDSARRLAVRYLTQIAAVESENAALVAQVFTDSLDDASWQTDLSNVLYWMTQRYETHIATERMADGLLKHQRAATDLVVKAAQYLMSRGRSLDAVSPALLARLRRNDLHSWPVCRFFIDYAARQGGFADESVAENVWRAYLGIISGLAPPSVSASNAADLTPIPSAMPPMPDGVACSPDCLLWLSGLEPTRAAVREFVTWLLDSGFVPTSLEGTKELCGAVAHAPDADRIVDELLESRLGSESERVRSAAVRLVAGGAGDAHRQYGRIKAALEDQDALGRRWGIEAVLWLNKPDADMLALLRKKAASDPATSVRAASLHAYGQLAPNDAGTREFVRSRLNDEKQVQLAAAYLLKQLEKTASAKAGSR